MEQYPLIPLRDILVYPSLTKPIIVGRPRSYKALEISDTSDRMLFLVLQKDAKSDDPTIDDFYTYGVVAQIKTLTKLPDGTIKTQIKGLYIAKIQELEERDGSFFAKVEKVEETELTDAETLVYKQILNKSLEEYAKTTGKISADLLDQVFEMGDMSVLVYTIADSLNVAVEQLQNLLESSTFSEKLDLVMELMQTELEIVRLDEKIKQRVKHQMAKSNKEYHLNEQLKAIQKEMGKDDDFKADLDEIEQRLKELTLPESVREKAERELRKMKIMPPMSAETTVVRNYLDWVVSLPWGIITEDSLDINNAENILNRDHFGLEKPKERILEYLAVRKLSHELKGPIICFVGPPGVGKTSLAKSIAESMGRNFVRISMGGVRDEAEIRGHRKTYIGSMPGKIIQSIKKAGSENPVFLLDEIDKLGSDYRGDPSAALLEALDPEQNSAFVDHYLEVDFDLSKVFFITTANTLESIPSALLDRMEIIRITGYTEQEKFNIAVKYLLPKQLKEHNLSEEQVKIEDDALYEVIRYYTKEAGVRTLEREIAALIRKAARKLTQNEDLKTVVIAEADVEEFLGIREYRTHTVYDDREIGVATGLAWTPYGGDLLQIEVALSEGTGKLQLTGKLGEVMQESAKTAFSVVKSRAKRFNVPMQRFKEVDFHLHVPEGAVPKDGPSAGITMATALMSAISESECNCRIAMTGEISLRGKVLPVGGIKEKVLAAHRAGLREIIMPHDNEKDLTDIPDDVKNDIVFHFVKSIDEVYNLDIILDKSEVL